MANVIRVTPEELKTASTRMATKADEMKKYTDLMMEIVEGLNGRIWSGEAQKEYVNRFELLKQDIYELHQDVKEHVDHLNVIANEYQSAENANKETASTLSADVIS